MFIRRIYPRKKFQTYIKYMMILWILYLYYVKLLVLLCEETVQPVWNWFLLAGLISNISQPFATTLFTWLNFHLHVRRNKGFFFQNEISRTCQIIQLLRFVCWVIAWINLSQQQSNRTKKISSEIDIAAIIQLSKTFFCDDIFKSLHS